MFNMSALSRHVMIDRRTLQYLSERLDENDQPLIRAHNFGKVSSTPPLFSKDEAEILFVVRPLINIFGTIKLFDRTIPEVRAFCETVSGDGADKLRPHLDQNENMVTNARKMMSAARGSKPTFLIFEYAENQANVFIGSDKEYHSKSSEWLTLHPCVGVDRMKRTIERLSQDHFSMTHLVVNFTKAIELANRPVE